jgi:hypothetical protein
VPLDMIACRHCGAPLESYAGGAFATCDYCGARLEKRVPAPPVFQAAPYRPVAPQPPEIDQLLRGHRQVSIVGFIVFLVVAGIMIATFLSFRAQMHLDPFGSGFRFPGARSPTIPIGGDPL